MNTIITLAVLGILLGVGFWPKDELKNVQVLPFKSKKEITRFMKNQVAKSLGVKCKFCHNLKDYPSDENPQKVVGREMMRMVYSINEQMVTIQKVAKDAGMERWEKAPVIECWACHRGSTKPEYSRTKSGK